MKRYFLVPALLLSASVLLPLKTQAQSTSSIQFCNRTTHKEISAVYVSYDGQEEGWTSHGWYIVPRGRCTTASIGRPYNGDVFVYGEAQGGRTIWGSSNNSFCVDNINAFSINNADSSSNCSQEGNTKMVPASVFTIRSGQNTWNFRPR